MDAHVDSQHFSITVFGALRLRDAAGDVVSLPCGPARLALERLCLTPNRPVVVADLVRSCWPHSTPTRGADAIAAIVARLRATLRNVVGVDVVSRDGAVVLEAADGCMDLLAFEEATSRCLHPSAPNDVASAERRRALALLARGPAFGGFRMNHAVRAGRVRIDDARDRLHNSLTDAAPSLDLAFTAAPSPTIVYVVVTSDELQALAGSADGRDVLGPLLARARQLRDVDMSLTAPAPNTPPSYGFSDREQTIAMLLTGSMSLPEISRHLSISINTTKTHTQAVYRKLGVSSRAEASARLIGDRNAAWRAEPALRAG
jgi:DNA-binding CsgD family transcriptional regulator